MIVRFFLAGPQGPFLLDPEDLKRPFKTSPSENHPCLSLRDYFESVRDLLLQEEARVLLKGLLAQGHGVGLKDIHEILIRLEKHGVLYHVARVEIHAQALVSALAVSTAVSEQAKAYLKKEYEVLQDLGNSTQSCVPRVYHLGERPWGTDPVAGTLVMMVSQWLEGYHEWHLSVDPGDVSARPCIWDSDAGYRWANPEEGFELFRQAAAILTLTYDLRTARHIYPWHHAAGDFVIRSWGGKIRVMLATARDYRPFPLLLGLNSMDPLMALVYFFLHLTLRIRMDRVDGLGVLILAGAPIP